MGSAARDTRLYDICDPYYGEKGTAYVRIFKPAFETGLAVKSDKYANFAQHLRGEDPGAVPPTDPSQRTNTTAHVKARVLFPGEQGLINARNTQAPQGDTAAAMSRLVFNAAYACSPNTIRKKVCSSLLPLISSLLIILLLFIAPAAY